MNRFLYEQCLEYNKSLLLLGNKAFESKPDHGLFQATLKRAIDVVFSLIVLAALSPVFLAIAILVKLTSPGSVIFSQERVGQDGKIFTIYKFRSMKQGANPYAYSPTKNNDRRVTKFGRFLRKSGLDELPQFINVLKGEMSVVGPRPEMEFIVKKYNNKERRRLFLKPGITGIWQIKTGRTKLIHQDIDFDLFYIDNLSISLDLLIMAETAWFMLRSIITK
ncbi:MAG TPA: sugar transferase [Candidatus Moranbacteria bacterium]|mgnify:CR=1 FL=1|nr:sugar transferase [Candidatus Moranbacteria bacterium]